MAQGDLRPVSDIDPSELSTSGAVFVHEGSKYRSTGRPLGRGGMGMCFLVERRTNAELELCVAKTFHSRYMHQLRTDEITRRDHSAVIKNMERLRQLSHPHLLPTYAAEPVGENYLTVTPLMDATLRQTIAVQALPDRDRVRLLIQALTGLAHLHSEGLLHRDFTLRNILVQDHHAYLFDFDLCLDLKDVEDETYRTYYQGRIVGSPGYSVPPEVLDTALMDSPITPALDIYAAGTALFSLFCDQLPAGPTADMWELLMRTSEGLVREGRSRIRYGENVPPVLRPIIERCMEREPERRFATVDELLQMLRDVLPTLRAQPTMSVVTTWTGPVDPPPKQKWPELSELNLLEPVEEILGREGYVFWRTMGAVLGHPIFAVVPDPNLVSEGRFPGANVYPKLVTLKRLPEGDEGRAVIDAWFGRYLPQLQRARQGLMTPLFSVLADEKSGILLLMSEYVEDPRFGAVLDGTQMTEVETLSLSFLIARQLARLHEVGIAHTNVTAESIMFKASHSPGCAFPALAGLVSPSDDESARITDVQALIDLTVYWLQRPLSDDSADTMPFASEGELTGPLKELALDARLSASTLIKTLRSILSELDVNFGILSQHGGDLNQYALSLVGPALYLRLWRR